MSPSIAFCPIHYQWLRTAVHCHLHLMFSSLIMIIMLLLPYSQQAPPKHMSCGIIHVDSSVISVIYRVRCTREGWKRHILGSTLQLHWLIVCSIWNIPRVEWKEDIDWECDLLPHFFDEEELWQAAPIPWKDLSYRVCEADGDISWYDWTARSRLEEVYAKAETPLQWFDSVPKNDCIAAVGYRNK